MEIWERKASCFFCERESRKYTKGGASGLCDVRPRKGGCRTTPNWEVTPVLRPEEGSSPDFATERKHDPVRHSPDSNHFSVCTNLGTTVPQRPPVSVFLKGEVIGPLLIASDWGWELAAISKICAAKCPHYLENTKVRNISGIFAANRSRPRGN